MQSLLEAALVGYETEKARIEAAIADIRKQRQCKDNKKWDRVFAKFAVSKYWDERGTFRSTLSDI